MTPKTRILTGLLAGAAALSSAAQAAVLFSDDFSASGSGTGWVSNTAWTGTGSDVVYSGTAGTVNLAGGSLVLTNGAANNTNARAHRALASGIDMNNAATDVWLAATIGYTGAATENAWFGVSFFDDYVNSGNRGTESLFFGASVANNVWTFTANGSTTPTTNPAVDQYESGVVQLLARIQDNQIDLWINPSDTSSVGALGAANASSAVSFAANTTLNAVRFGAGTNTNGDDLSQITVSNIRASTTFAEAIPEPSTSLLVAFAASALFLRHRRA